MIVQSRATVAESWKSPPVAKLPAGPPLLSSNNHDTENASIAKSGISGTTVPQNGKPSSAKSLYVTSCKPAGTHPVRRLPARSNDSKLCKFPSSDGISPLNWFSRRFKPIRLERRPKAGGICASKRLCPRYSSVRLDKSPSSSGIGPLNWFCTNEILETLPAASVVTVVKMVDFSHRPQSAKPLRRPNSARRLRPGFSPGNTELIPAQATPRASARTTA